jgi:predicted permease
MMWNWFVSFIHWLRSRRQTDDDLEEELNAHIDLQMKKYVAAGWPPAEAYRRARIEFGARDAVLEECREIDPWRWPRATMRNCKHSVRSLRRSPGFAFTFTLILVIAIAANLAVFSTINAVFFRPLPIHDPQQLVRISWRDRQGNKGGLFPVELLTALRENRAFQGLCGFDTSYRLVQVGGTLRSSGIAGFAGSCFETLGIPLQAGRPISPNDDRPGAERVAVISGEMWRDVFGGRANVLGSRIRVETEEFTIIGVTSERFRGLLLGFPEPVMIPLRQEPSMRPDMPLPTDHPWVNVLARLGPGIAESQAAASVAAQTNALLQQSIPPSYGTDDRKQYTTRSLTVSPASSGVDYFLRDRFGASLYAMFGICGAVLIIACLNLVTLLLARTVSRSHEIAVRLALGASRFHVAGTIFLEAAILICIAAGLGIAAGLWAAETFVCRVGEMFGNFNMDLGLDIRVGAALVAAIFIIAASFAIASVWQTGRLSSAHAVKMGGRGVIASNSFAQKGLVAVQIAFTLAFVTTGAVFGLSLKNMYNIDFGIQPQNVWIVQLAPKPGGYKGLSLGPYYRDLLQQVGSLPNVEMVTVNNTMPFVQSPFQEPVKSIENAQVGELEAETVAVGENYFRTLGAKIIGGDDFRAGDTSGEPAVILSESLARRLGPLNEVVGEHVQVGAEHQARRLKVIGIASDIDVNLANHGQTKSLTAYLNFWQAPDLQGYSVLMVKTRTNTLSSAAILQIVNQHGHEYIERFGTLRGQIDQALAVNRLLAYLSGAFSLVALVMAAVGLFGVLNYQVANRTSEIGIRMALGANRWQINRLFLRHVTIVLLVGVSLGLAMTMVLEKLMRGLLYGVEATDPSLLIFSTGILAVTAGVAAWIPVRRASGVDPVQAMRHE